MRIAILGCGYVGLELGRQLAARGHDVVGVRRSASGIEAIETNGFEAVRADVTDADALAAVPDVDALAFLASSGGRGAEAARTVFVEGLRTVVEHFGARSEAPQYLVYASSTGVYGDHGSDWVDELTPLEPTTEKTRVLAEAETIAREEAPEHGLDATVARLAGLYGPDRYRLERYIEGPVTEGYLNLVHRDDAAGAIRHLLERERSARQVAGTRQVAGSEDRNGDVRGEVVLVVDDEPVDRWAFADWLADRCGVDRPAKRTVEDRLATDDLSERARRRLLTSKRCSNARLRALDYEFTYPTYREGYRDAIEAYRGVE